MIRRNILQTIIKFGKKEFLEKKPLSVKILKVKERTVLTRGILPSLKVSQIKDVFYLVVSEYTTSFRIYYFSHKGILLGGENFKTNEKLLKKLKKYTKLRYQFPK